ncbi:Modification methylase DpnIIA [subsurface metagenome]
MSFKYVRDCPDLVSRYLREHARNNRKRYYYQMRKLYNRSSDSPAQAARFIYLNKTCFNGIFRVNQKDLFNVPYGKQKSPYIPNAQHLRNVAAILKSAKIFIAPFEKALERAKKNDFIYLDPPYPPLNGTSCFNHYTIDKFDDKQQEKLAATVKELDATGCFFMVSNANTKKIRQLYKGYNINKLKVTRFITCKSKRHKVQELIITNYEVF